MNMNEALVNEIFKLNVETQKIAKRKEAIQEAEKAKDKKWHTWDELTTDAMESIIEGVHGHGGCKNNQEAAPNNPYDIHLTGDPIKDNIEVA